VESRLLPRHRERWRQGGYSTEPRWGVSKRGESELGRQIAVDLETDANLNQRRGRPSHGRFLSKRAEDNSKHGSMTRALRAVSMQWRCRPMVSEIMLNLNDFADAREI
jgi:hypothetical protein